MDSRIDDKDDAFVVPVNTGIDFDFAGTVETADFVLILLYGLTGTLRSPAGRDLEDDFVGADGGAATLVAEASVDVNSLDLELSIRPNERLLTTVAGKKRFTSIEDSPTLVRCCCFLCSILLVPSISSKSRLQISCRSFGIILKKERNIV